MSMRQRKVQSLIGLAGDECEQARLLARKFELPMLLVALWLLVEWYAVKHHVLPETVTEISNRVIWLFFILETAMLTYLVEDKWRYLKLEAIEQKWSPHSFHYYRQGVSLFMS